VTCSSGPRIRTLWTACQVACLVGVWACGGLARGQAHAADLSAVDEQVVEKVDPSATDPAPAPAPPPTPVHAPTIHSNEWSAKGLASWYGDKFHGRLTASGERYDKHALTAAHRTLPFGTLVRVRSARTGREVVVRINDRGPYARHRVIDLSSAAAAALGIKGRGIASVTLLRE
jgi:rare lipoprotein A